MTKEELEIMARCPACGSGNVISDPENMFNFEIGRAHV